MTTFPAHGLMQRRACAPEAVGALASAGPPVVTVAPPSWAEGSPYMLARLLNMSAGLELGACEGCCCCC